MGDGAASGSLICPCLGNADQTSRGPRASSQHTGRLCACPPDQDPMGLRTPGLSEAGSPSPAQFTLKNEFELFITKAFCAHFLPSFPGSQIKAEFQTSSACRPLATGLASGQITPAPLHSNSSSSRGGLASDRTSTRCKQPPGARARPAALTAALGVTALGTAAVDTAQAH